MNIFSDNKEDITAGIKEAQIFALENNQSIVLTYKSIDSEKIESSLVENKEDNIQNPFPDFPY